MNEQYNAYLINAAWKALPGEVRVELDHILQYWEQFAMDGETEGFVGRIDQDNKIHERAAKGSVLNARILWTFSAAYNFSKNPAHLKLASRAYQYIREFFTDHAYGGLYWSVDFQGRMLETHKQVYAQAFGIYGLSEYYRASKNAEALEAGAGPVPSSLKNTVAIR